MASTSSNPAKQRKRVEADTPAILKRAKDGSAFARWYAFLSLQNVRHFAHLLITIFHDYELFNFFKP